MELSASEVYHLTVDKLRLVFVERGLDASGPVLLLRRRFVEHVKNTQMDLNLDQETPQASVQTNIMNNVMESVPPTPGLHSHGSSAGCQTPVVVELVSSYSVVVRRTGGDFDVVCPVG
jgi:hypothetical protein